MPVNCQKVVFLGTRRAHCGYASSAAESSVSPDTYQSKAPFGVDVDTKGGRRVLCSARIGRGT
jgi:hypothetical protein